MLPEGKVAIFLPDLRGGGAERVMLNIAMALSDLGCTVDMVLASKQGEYLELVPPAVRVIDLGVTRAMMSIRPLAAYLKSQQPSVLISAPSHMSGVAVIARVLSRTSTGVIITVHNTMSVESATGGMRQRLVPNVMRCIAPMADAIVAVSQGVADDLATLAGIPRHKIKVIYNPVISADILQRASEPLDHPCSPANLQPTSKASPVLDCGTWFRDGEPPVILAVGRLNPQKDLSTLLRAFAIVRRRRRARLLILGQGEERPHLERLICELGIGEDTSLPGFVANPYSFMRRSRVLALSSRFEGLPTVLIEALACGCPVVSTDCPSGPREILSEIAGGTLVPVGDPERMAEALLNALDGPKPALDHETWARYTLPVAASNYLELIAAIISDPKRQQSRKRRPFLS